MTVTSPYDNPQQISEDVTIAFAQLDVEDRSFEEVTVLGKDIREFGAAQPGVEGCRSSTAVTCSASSPLPESEILGIIAAVIILILAFGSVLAMGLPIGTALFGLGVGSSIVALASNVISMPEFTTAMVAMIGLGVGIDYALFIVTRYREGLKLGLGVEERSPNRWTPRARRPVRRLTVIISLMGLTLVGLSFVTGVAIASAIGVAMMILAAMTLVPALLGLVGTRIDNTSRAALIAVGIAVVGAIAGFITGSGGAVPGRIRLAIVFFAISFAVRSLRSHPAPRQRAAEQRFWYRWSRFVQHRPWPSTLGAAAFLLILAIPLFSIRLGFSDLGNTPEDKTVRRAYDLLAEGFGPGSNGPLFITVEGDTANDPAAVEQFAQTVAGTEGVRTAFPAGPPLADGLSLVIVYPDSAPQDAETTELVNTLRDDVIPETGLAARSAVSRPGPWTSRRTSPGACRS